MSLNSTKELHLLNGLKAIIDAEDYERLSVHTWFAQHLRGRMYIVSKGGKTHRLNHLVLQPSSRAIIKYRNGNKFDNRKSNLYIAGEDKTKTALRFWEYVIKGQTPNDCWQWKGSTNSDGYGSITQKEKRWGAHRFSWMVHFGDIPNGLHVLHKCDNPPCTNPEHLFLGTNLDNIKDSVSKGRRKYPPKHSNIPAKGSGHGMAKLSEREVLQIRLAVASGATQQSQAVTFNVSKHTVCLIIKRKTWRHV